MKHTLRILALLLAAMLLVACGAQSTALTTGNKTETETETAEQTEVSESVTITQSAEVATEALSVETFIEWDTLCNVLDEIWSSQSLYETSQEWLMAEIPEGFWNECGAHSLNSASHYLYTCTPDGYEVYLYNLSAYELFLDESSSVSHVGYSWWEEVLPGTVVKDGDLVADDTQRRATDATSSESISAESSDYTMVDWNTLCAALSTTEITTDNYQSYITLGWLPAEEVWYDNDIWCYLLTDASKCLYSDVELTGWYSFRYIETLTGAENGETLMESTQSMTWSFGIDLNNQSESGDYYGYVNAKEIADENDVYITEDGTGILADYRIVYEITEIQVLLAQGTIYELNLDESCWNPSDACYPWGDRFLYTVTPAGCKLYLYDNGYYLLVGNTSSAFCCEESWWARLSTIGNTTLD